MTFLLPSERTSPFSRTRLVFRTPGRKGIINNHQEFFRANIGARIARQVIWDVE